MISGFEKLSDNQFEITKEAIAWITILVAGADGKIDADETDWAKKLADIRGYSNPNILTPFYEEVGKDFSQKIDHLIGNVPDDRKERQAILERKISQLNDILPLVENSTAYALYLSYKSFAKHVAKASGGFLGFLSVSGEEEKLINLPMLNPIEKIAEEE